jgi:hypothetical protein
LEKDYIILIPSYNELESLKKILPKLKKENFDILIIDDFSKDKTHHYLKKKKYFYLRNIKQSGYERTVKIGFKHILRSFNYKYIITFDADGEHDVMELKKIIKFHKKYEPDILICNRSVLNRWSEYFISYIFNFFFKIKDPLSGLKIYKTFKLKQVINKIKDNNYLVDIVYSFNKRNFKTMNFLTKVNKRNGKSKLGQEYLVNLKILSLLRLFF